MFWLLLFGGKIDEGGLIEYHLSIKGLLPMKSKKNFPLRKRSAINPVIQIANLHKTTSMNIFSIHMEDAKMAVNTIILLLN